MEIIIAAIGRTTTPYIKEGLGEYLRRLGHYASVKLLELADTRRGKSVPEAEQKLREGKLILSQLNPADYVVLLDERGREHTSEEFARWLDKRMGSGRKRLVLVIGGPYGFSPEVYDSARRAVPSLLIRQMGCYLPPPLLPDEPEETSSLLTEERVRLTSLRSEPKL